MREKILLIEDDRQIGELLKDQVELLGYALVVETDGAAGLTCALAEPFVLVLLDLNLPSLGGMEICQRLKRSKPDLPVIMLTARGSEIDRVLGLELGADDYVVKPFSVAELSARIKARLRARKVEPGGSGEVFGPLQIDHEKRRVIKNGVPIEVTNLEFDLLALLSSAPGRAFSRDELLDKLWGVTADVYENNPTSVIAKLRKKIEDVPSDPKFIKTVWGFGYKFVDRSELESEN